MISFNGYMKGINLGGWLSQCVHTEELYNTFITESDIKTIAEWGLDHVRLPIDAELFETPDGEYIESGFAHIDDCFDWCIKYGLNVVIDVHKTAGYSFTTLGNNTLFEDEALQSRFIRMWQTLAARYVKYGEKVAFELLNEIVEQTPDRWNSLTRRVVSEIRVIAPTTKILLGGIKWNSASTVKYLDMPYDENIVYNFHFYEPFLFTHQKARWIREMPTETMNYRGRLDEYKTVSQRIQCFDSGLSNVSEIGPEFLDKLIYEAVKVAEERKAALYCGEYGVIDHAPAEDTLKWYQDINSVFVKYGIGRAAWTYKKKNFGISDEHYADVREGIVKAL